jgi:tetratricopeptide (TPR) repeat protein
MRWLVVVLLLLSPAAVQAADEKVGRTDPMQVAIHEFEQEHFEATLAAIADKEKGEPTAKTLDLKGRVYLEMGKYDEAIAAFEESFRLEQTSTAKMHIADTLMRQKSFPEARNVYREALKLTNILVANEKLRYGVLVSSLAAEDEEEARTAFENVPFPTESAAYYYAQAAWAFAHGDKAGGEKWLRRGEGIFSAKTTGWFARPLYDLGWIKTKPALSATD